MVSELPAYVSVRAAAEQFGEAEWSAVMTWTIGEELETHEHIEVAMTDDDALDLIAELMAAVGIVMVRDAEPGLLVMEYRSRG